MLNAIVDAALRYKVLVIVAFGVLVGLGIVSLLYSGFSYTKNKRAVDLGPLQVDVKEKKDKPLRPGMSVVVVVQVK